MAKLVNDPVIVPHSVNCFYGKVGKRSVLTEGYVTDVSRAGMCTVGVRQYIRAHEICVRIPIKFFGGAVVKSFDNQTESWV